MLLNYDEIIYSQVIGFDIQYVNPTTPAISARGMLTGTMVRMLDNSAIEVTAMYYDDRGRVVQSRTNNRLNGYDYDLYHYSFTGQVLSHRHIHKIPTVSTELIENYRFTYDHADRLISTFHKLNTRAEVKLSELVYDELGRVSRKILHSGGETIDYSYNIRNWTKSITTNRFSQTLYYLDALDGKPVYYNGNISAIKWGTGATQDKKYYFSYDGLNRMTNAAYSPDNIFDEKVDQYDKHGNILSLKRSGWVQDWSNEEPIQGYVDYMTMTYNGNQLKNADDMVEEIFNQSPNDFYNVWDENIETEYLYDANGNQYADLNKGIAWIKYNLLNLPEKIQFQNGNKIEYLYDALGVKRQAKWSYSTSTLNIPLGSTVQENNSLQGTTTTEYCGNYIYEQGQIKRLLTTEGYMTNGGYVPLILLSQWRYNYTLKDYQGNTRQTLYGNMLSGSQNVLFASGSSTIDYYPFGMEITTPEGNYTSGTNPYLYNGKEIDRMHGLNQYDYGARWRDGALPPWTTVDPLAEKYYSISPYAYCANNPVRYVDPDGNNLKDAIVGTLIGIVTNVVPGTTALREAYTPSDAADYNSALRSTDNAAMAVGEVMVRGGASAVGAGGAVAIAGGSVSLSGVGVTVGAPTTAVGVTVAGAGAATAAGGAFLMTNGATNASAGYDYGEKSSSTKSDNKLKPNKEATGDHSSFKTDGTGKTTNTATYKQNPKNPTGFDEVKRVDVTGKAHNGVNTPHVHEPKQPVRPARLDELPKQ